MILLAAACGKSKASPAAGKGNRKLEYPVEVAPVDLRNVQYSVTAPGSIEAFQQVQITARVAGAVDKVLFVEGQPVKEGDVLVLIEGERYQLAVEQARAAYTKAATNEKSQEKQLERRQAAAKENPGVIPGEEIESHQASVDAAKADMETAIMALKVAELNLRDSSVKAPIAGIVQTRTVQTGQYLTTGAVLATIVQRDPLLLRFQVTEQDRPRVKAGMRATMRLRESSHEYSALIKLVADAADPTTRLTPVTAEIDSTDHQYWLRAGAFCEVAVPIDAPRKGIVLPSLAVEPTEKGNIVYVVDDKNIAHVKVVELGMHTPDGGVEITRGLKEGDIVVVRGLEPLTDGAPVKIVTKTTLAESETPDAGPPAPANPPTDGGAGK
jgi:RND family efflux transporter MFP subunit